MYIFYLYFFNILYEYLPIKWKAVWWVLSHGNCHRFIIPRFMSKIIITSDSTSDLSEDIIRALGIRIIPLYVNIGDDSYKDGVNISQKEIFESFEKNQILAKTSAVSIYDFQVFFQSLLEEGYEIIHFSISSLFSSSHQNAITAANILDTDKISLVDSMNLSTGIGLQLMRAGELSKQGLTRAEIIKDIESYSQNINSSFIIDSLTYLWKGGRCSGISAFGANLIQIKPCIEVLDGTMKVGKKYRGSLERSYKAYINERLKNLESIDSKRIFIVHTIQDEKLVDKVKDIVESKNHFEEVLVSEAGCTISSHCGPGTLGLMYISK